jgi:hypothetical protein
MLYRQFPPSILKTESGAGYPHLSLDIIGDYVIFCYFFRINQNLIEKNSDRVIESLTSKSQFLLKSGYSEKELTKTVYNKNKGKAKA